MPPTVGDQPTSGERFAFCWELIEPEETFQPLEGEFDPPA
jgi:hypothetical protein